MSLDWRLLDLSHHTLSQVKLTRLLINDNARKTNRNRQLIAYFSTLYWLQLFFEKKTTTKAWGGYNGSYIHMYQHKYTTIIEFSYSHTHPQNCARGDGMY